MGTQPQAPQRREGGGRSIRGAPKLTQFSPPPCPLDVVDPATSMILLEDGEGGLVKKWQKKSSPGITSHQVCTVNGELFMHQRGEVQPSPPWLKKNMLLPPPFQTVYSSYLA